MVNGLDSLKIANRSAKKIGVKRVIKIAIKRIRFSFLSFFFHFSLCFLPLFLTGCMSSRFDCPRSDGVSCTSLYDVNDMINRGEIDKNGVRNFKAKKKSFFTSSPSSSFSSLWYSDGRTEFVETTERNETNETTEATKRAKTNGSSPRRIPEKTAEIVIFPYESGDGVYHQTSVLSTVLSEAYWEE